MDKTIYMAEFGVVGRDEGILRTTLGSCVGLVLIDERTGKMGLAHIVLPKCHENATPTPGKFADTAGPALFAAMGLSAPEAPRRLKAKIAGGANMFAGIVKNEMIRMGEQNIRAVREWIAKAGIALVAENVGGTKGCKVVLDPKSGKVTVSSLGGGTVEL